MSVSSVFASVSDAVAALEIDSNVPVPEFGELALHTHNNDVRKIVVVPGDEGRSFGRIGAPRGFGRPYESQKRRIFSGPELFRVYLAGYDRANPTDALVQYNEAMRLLEVVLPMLRVAHRDFQYVSGKWVLKSLLAPFGASLMIVCSVQRSYLDWVEGESVDAAPVDAAVTSGIKYEDTE